MPRIPIRIEPYSSPSKQHRHYKSKRDQVLRALGKAAYINGSQFALLLVSARGDVETYASEALQNRLDPWFVKSGIADEARHLAKKSHEETRTTISPSINADDVLGDNLEDIVAPASASSTRVSDDPFLDSWCTLPMDASQARQSNDDWQLRVKREAAAEEISGTMDQMSETSSPHPKVPRTSTPVHASVFRRVPQPAVMRPNTNGAHIAYTLELKDEEARTAFFELRFSQLQQVMCKMIAKEWVKVIEPKKQTRFPYNKGEAGKPAWWPADVRHKEPDHLMKPERHALLLAILRSPQTRIARLQLATAEVVALIKAGKVAYLMDVYRVAREEEKLRDDGMDKNTPITVSVSSLEGWDAAAGCPSALGMNSSADTSDYESKEVKGKRRLSSRWDDDEHSEPNTSVSWTPTMNDVYSPQSHPLVSTVPPPSRVPFSGGHSGLGIHSADLPSKGRTPGSTPEVSMLSPSLSTETLAQGPTLNMGASMPVPLVQSPVTTSQPLPIQSYGAHGTDLPRSSSISHPVTSVPMRPTHSSPAHFNQQQPEGLNSRPSQSSIPSIHFEQHTNHGNGSLDPHAQRVPWSVHTPVTPYQRSQVMSWSMPETPAHWSSSVVPMAFGMNASPSHDVYFSNSFDSSFSASNHGPMTPGQFASMPINGVVGSSNPGVSTSGQHPVSFQELGLSHVQSTHVQPMQAKQGAVQNDIRLHSMAHWPTR